MRKVYFSAFSFIVFLLLQLSAMQTNAQVDIPIGTGTVGNTTTTYPCPLQDFYEGSRMQYLYLASELTAAGMGPGNINALKYNVVSVGVSGLIEQYTIKIGGTAVGTLSATAWENAAATVYGPANYQPVVGINTLTFATPYFWNGTDNLVIEICNGEPGNATGTWFTENPVVSWTTGLAFNGSHSYRADNLGNLCGTATTTNTGTQTTRPNVVINWTPAAACAGIPTAGTANANPSTVCLGTPFTLSATGVTVASGLTYQWQSSPDNISFTDILGATGTSYTTTQTVSTYYQLVVECTVSGGVATSTSVLVTSPSLVSGTFTINNLGPATVPNFQTFNAAYDYIKCGISGAVIFNVDPLSGPYNEQLIMSPVPGASAANTVTFNGSSRTINFLSTVTGERAVIKLNGADHIKFDNLVITALGASATEYGFGVQLLNDADSNAVTNCVININSASTSTNYCGISISASATSATTTGNTLSDGNVFTGNTIAGGYYGITCVGSTTAANRDNIISGNLIKDFYFYGIYILGNFNTQIDSNTVTRPERATVSTCNGIYLTSLNVSVNVTRNTITDPFGGAPASTALFNGIFVTGVDALSGVENKVINNRIYNISGAGEANGINTTGSDNVWVQHNTILMDGTGGIAITRGLYQTTLAAGVRYENNIVAINRGGTGAKYATYHATTTSDIYSNDNVFFIYPLVTNAFTGFYTTAQASLANWQAASGDDINSLASNPLFTDIPTGNLRPTNAAVDNQGAPVGVLIDITALPRSATSPDMGAYEFTPAACTTPPVPGVTAINPSSVCISNTVSIGLNGSFGGLGQTYQWQVGPTLAGPWTNLGNLLSNPDSTIISTISQYYRVIVTCSGISGFSDPALLTVNPALPGGTYTIDLGTPTAGTNYNNFNDAKAAMNCGIAGNIIFNVLAGTGPYNEQLILDSIVSVGGLWSVTFNGNANIIAFSSSNNTERAVIKLRKADRVTFDNLEIDATGAGTYGYAVELFNNADSNTINNCTIKCNTTATSTNFAGIVVNNSEAAAVTTGNTLCDGNTFSNNTITGGYYGITLVGGITATTIPINGNIVTGNAILDYYFYGVYISGTTNTLVEGNLMSRPSRAVVTTGYGVYATGLSSSLRISKNRITNPFGGNTALTAAFAGIYITGVDGASPNIVSNNLVYGINGAGIQYGLYNSSSDNTKYFHNTISLQDNANTSTTAAYGFYQTLAADGIEVQDNIFTVSRAGDGNKFGLYFVTNPATIASNYNDLYVIGTNAFTGFNGTNRVTLADWQTATTQDANSVAFNPIYTNAAGGNFSPQFPPLDNIGTPVGITTDILNAPRSATTPDVGAYEFLVPACTAPPVAGAATANPSSGICLGASVDLALSGYNFGGGQTYQWEYSVNAGGPWTPMGGPRLFPDTTIFASTTLYYHVLVTCGGNTVASVPVLVTLDPTFLSGYYTIDPALPPTLPNFQNFVSAVSALDCGITGFVIFDVAPGTYNEQVRMHNIAGTGAGSRVTFRSANGDPASVILTYDATVAANNYVLKLDSAKYISYDNMTITAINAANGRAVQLANTASFDSIVNCRINTQTTTLITNAVVGVFADLLKGSGNVIKGNTITSGSDGIYFNGTAATNYTYDNVIDSNFINNTYFYGIYVGNNARATVSRNTVTLTSPRNAANYGIYSVNSDSAFHYTGNKVNIDGMTATNTYGMYFTACDGKTGDRGIIAGNTIMALTGNTGNIYGLYQTACTYNNTVNNVISVNTTGATSYGSYYTTGGGVNFHNNTVISTSTSATNNIAAYFGQTSGALPFVNAQNNIFSHQGGGIAMHMANLNFNYSNYNTFYSSGAQLIRGAAINYATLQAWINFSNWDLNSIAVLPTLISTSDLRPDPANPDVWAIHGRGTQIPGNDYDFNNNPRPTTFTAGVPDMGAYEFLPTSLPTVLTATPAVPAPGITQTFMYATDTVARITYDATAPVPASITLRRYSGVLPTGLGAGQQSMYFYTAIDVPAQGAYKYKMEQYYIDPWRGFIATEPEIRMGRTDATNTWIVGPASSTDIYSDIITDTNLVHFDRYTGIAGDPATLPPYTTVIDTSNRGTRFWVPYGHHQQFSANSQDMLLYLSAEDSANVTVRINGTSWKRTYAIPANTVRVSDLMPKSGLVDARILDEGLFEHGISITSDVPIVAYAHIYAATNSAATMLMPVGVYGYDYQSLNARQYYAADCYSWTCVLTDRDSTLVEITPAVTTKGGRPAGVPFTVLLMKGQVYNVMGTTNGATGTEMTGTKVKSIPNTSGHCYPIAVFSGSSRTAICYFSNGDNMVQQVFPSQAWGKKYVTFATANANSNTQYNSNIFRVMVKDPTTVVTKNGAVLDPLTLINPGGYYQFNTTSGNGANGAIAIEADKPVMVGQYMVSSGADECPGVTAPGNGDPELIYIPPIEQGIKRSVFYVTNKNTITNNYVNIVVPTGGLASLTIDGSSTFTDVFAHPFLAGYTCVRQNFPVTASQHIALCDSSFTITVYGLGAAESYGYTGGTLVKNLNALPNIVVNTQGTGAATDYTCVKAPFNFTVFLTSSAPTALTWQLSGISTLTPNTDVTQNNPVPVGTVVINGKTYYKYSLPGTYTFSAPGTYTIPILVTDPANIDGCNNTLELSIQVKVIASPVADFTSIFSGCIGAPVILTGIGTTANGIGINTWTWDFGDLSPTASGQNTSHSYLAPGTYNINLNIVALDGCVGDTTKPITVNALAAVAVVSDSLVVCGNDPVTFEVLNPDPGSTYDWFTTLTGGVPVFTGPTYTVPSVTGTIEFYVQATNAAGCISERKRVKASILADLAIPVARVDSIGVDLIRFAWDPVPNAVTYEVSIDNGANWITPSSGPAGLTHTVTGLLPLTDVTLIVRATGTVSCQTSISAPVTAKTLSAQIYIPNAFTPNADGLNDILLVYGSIIKELRFMVYNQWGEKIFESSNQATGWNGTYKGKAQPSGVYMYVCQITLKDGTTQVKKGSLNLVR